MSAYRIIRTTFLILAVAISVLAQDDGCRHRRVGAMVLDGRGHPVSNLTSKEFDATAGAKSVRIVSVEPDAHPHRVIVVLDASRDMMRPQAKWNMARSLAAEAIQASNGHFRAGLVVFGSGAEQTASIEQGPAAALKVLKNLPTGHKNAGSPPANAYWDSLQTALGMLSPPEFGDVIYAITDAEKDPTSKVAKEIHDAMVNRGVRFFLLEFSDPFSSSGKDKMVSSLADWINDTGGFYVQVPTTSQTGASTFAEYSLDQDTIAKLANSVRVAYLAIEFEYRLEIELEKRPGKPQGWELQVLRPEAASGSWHVIYPRLLAACHK